MAIHFSILAEKIPWTEGPGGLQSLGSQRVGHDSAHTHAFLQIEGMRQLCRASLEAPFFQLHWLNSGLHVTF